MERKVLEIRNNYDIGYFCPHGIVPTPDIIGRMNNVFSEMGFLPNIVTGFQLGPQTGIMDSNQLQLITNEKDWIINFEPHRILIKRQNTINNHDMNFAKFIERVDTILTKLMEIIELKAQRLSYVTSGLCKEMKLEELNYVSGNIFKLPTLYQENHPIEWNSRQITRIEKSN